MTGYTVHTGSNDKFSSGWDRAFGSGKKGTKNATTAKSAAAKKPAKSKKKSK